MVCWGGGIRAGEASRLNKLVRKASSVFGLELDSLESVAEEKMKDKIKAMLESPSHPPLTQGVFLWLLSTWK